jgi:DNA (cytosine-5)-methyltransferase 1
MSFNDISNTPNEYLQGLLRVEIKKQEVSRRENRKLHTNTNKPNQNPYKNLSLTQVKKSSTKKLFSVVSFFCGAGGSSTGYKSAGGDIRLVNDFQEFCIRSYLNNYPDTPNICADIRSLTGKQILKKIGMKPRELDVLDGSPPCPPFSMSGRKTTGWNKTKKVYGKYQSNIEDLTFDFIDIAETIQPKVIVCENVKGLTMSPVKSHFDKMLRGFERIGYQTTFKILNSVNYGVPQKRERVFIVSIRNDVLEDLGHSVGAMVFPDFTDRIFPQPSPDIFTLKDAIHGLMKDKHNINEGNILEDVLKTQSKYKYVKKLPKNPIVYQSVGDVNPSGNQFQTRRVPWSEPSQTLQESGLMTTFFCHLHPDFDRGYTTYEAMRIMGLPKDYELVGTLNERLGCIGLMVAPPQMYHLSKHIYENVLKPLKC